MNSFITRRFASALLLVVYGTAAVLGYGLHALWHHDHDLGAAHSASGHSATTACSHRSSCSHHAKPAGPPKLHVEEEDCSICAFLAQAQTPVFELVVVETVASFEFEVAVSESIPPLFIPTDHLARGPPLG